ncbi:tetratricopeptide repeat protein [Lysinibacillus sphaericus]|uniref:tetratricopeptide repeat protein n=2 Tax=Lysinibacillus sphaericus TaxID=1421 RepID=UPI0038120376
MNINETEKLKKIVEKYLSEISEYVKIGIKFGEEDRIEEETISSKLNEEQLFEDEDFNKAERIRYKVDKQLFTILIEGFTSDNSYLFWNKEQFSFIRFLLDSILLEIDENDIGSSLDKMLNENINFKLLNTAMEFTNSVLNIEKNKELKNNFLNYIEKISMLNYEGISVSAKLLIINEDDRKNNIDMVVNFKQPIEYKETKKIRKIFEMSSENIFVIGDTYRIFGLGKFKDASFSKGSKLEDRIVVFNFEGKLDYKINLIEFNNSSSNTKDFREKLIIGFKDKSIILNKFEFPTDKLKGEINETFKSYFHGKNYDALQISEKVSSVCKIIKHASHQKSGTMVVITTPKLAESEITRLNSQCFRVDEIDIFNLGNPTISKTLINQLTSIDGALYIDIESKFHAIGVILDGLATDEADSSRGARYNSAIRYQKMEKIQTKKIVTNDCIVVVLSEDGMVDIVGNSIKNYESNKNELNLLLDKSSFDEVIQKASQYIGENESIIEYYLIRAKAYTKLDKIAEAVIDYDNAIRINSFDSQTYVSRGILKKKLGEINEALLDYSKAIELNPNYATAYNNRGILYYDILKYKEALVDYSKAIKINPNYAVVYYNRGILNKKIGNNEETLLDYSKAIELNPNFAEAYNNRGILYYDNSKYKEALADYNKAIKLNPNYATAYNNRGILNKQLEKNKEALLDYSRAIELNPNYAEAYNNRGILNKQLEKNKEALLDYSRAIELSPNYAEAYNNRGILNKKLEKNEEALLDYSRAIELNPNFAEAYNNRGILNKKLKKNEEALLDYSRAIELNPNYAEAYNNRGNLYKNIAKYKEALEDYNKAIDLNPNYTLAYNNRGNLYKNIAKYKEALEDYNKAIELNPNYTLAYKNRESLLSLIG